MKKLYTLFVALMLGCLLSAHAQDSTICNPNFAVSITGDSALFQAVDRHAGVFHSWDFGDGHSQTYYNTSSASHTYGVPGRYYTVKHTIRDSTGRTCRDSTSETIYIDSVPTPPACHISYTVVIDSSHLPNKLWLYANPAVHGRDSLNWTVNGNIVSHSDSVFYDTFSAGIYTICVNLRTASGCTASYCQNIAVNGHDSTDTTHTPPPPPPPHDTCSISFTYTVHVNEVHFMAHDSSGLDSLTWFITSGADTIILHGQTPIHVFTDTGYYNVLLYARNPAGCYSWSEQMLHIDSLPGSKFVTAYPNPTHGDTRLDLKLDQEEPIYINIFNSMGHLVISQKVLGLKGMNQIVLPTAELPSGIYYVQIQYGNVSKRSKIQKL